MDEFSAYDKEWERAYKQISKSSGIPVQKLVNRCLAVVKDEKSRYYGQIGVIEKSDLKLGNYSYGVRFKTRRLAEFSFDMDNEKGISGLEEIFYYTTNAILVAEQLNRTEDRRKEIAELREERASKRKRLRLERERYPLLSGH